MTAPGPDRSVVFQQFALFPWKTVTQNIEFGLRSLNIDAKTRAERVKHYIEFMGLAGYEQGFPHQLSGGMQQRVAIARAYVLDPKVLLMDEPFGALDALTRSEMHRVLMAVREQVAPTIVLVTHDIAEAVAIADSVLVASPAPMRIVSRVCVADAGPDAAHEILTSLRAAGVNA